MALTPAELAAHKDALLIAISSGELRVQVGDEEVTYRDVWQLKEALQVVESELKAADSGRLGIRYRVATFSD